MELEYFHCHSCGTELFDTFCAYSRCTADGEHYICPECGQESSDFVDGEEFCDGLE